MPSWPFRLGILSEWFPPSFFYASLEKEEQNSLGVFEQAQNLASLRAI
jgi:hypothetical protein